MSLPAYLIDVRSCGAAGDGVTDDTIAIQTAFNQLSQSPSPGMAVVFPPGIYLVGSSASGNKYLQVQNATDFEIRGHGATIRNASSEPNNSRNYDTLRVLNCQRFKIVGLAIDGNKANRGGGNDSGPNVLWLQQCSDFVLRDCLLENACCDTLYLDSSDGTVAHGVQDGVIDGCTLDGASRNGISIINAAKLKIINNTIRNVSGTPSGPWNGIDMEPNPGTDVSPVNDDILVADNLFVNCVGGAVYVRTTVQGAYVTVDGNEVVSCPSMYYGGGWHCRVTNNIGHDIIRPATGPGSAAVAAIGIAPAATTGSGAAATAVLGGGVTNVSITSGGSGYSSSFSVTFTGGGGSGALGTATASGGVVTGVTMTSAGSGYTSPPTANFSAGGGTGAAGVGALPVASVTVSAGGTSYNQYAPPLVTFTGGNGSGATGISTVNSSGVLTSIAVTNGGWGYTSAPTVGISMEQQAVVSGNKIYNIGGGLHGVLVYANLQGIVQVTENQFKTIRGGGAAILSYGNFTHIAQNVIEDSDSYGIAANDGTDHTTIIANKLRNTSATSGSNIPAIYVGGTNTFVKDNDIIDWGGSLGSIRRFVSGGYSLVDGNFIRATSVQSTWISILLGANDVIGPNNYCAFMSENQSQTPAALPGNTNIPVPVASPTANYSATNADEMILANASTAAFTVTLPTAVGNAGKQYTVKKTDSSAHVVTVATAGGNIDGSATYTSLTAQYKSVMVVSDGTNWQILATH